MSYDSQFSNNSMMSQDSMPLPSPDSGVYQYFSINNTIDNKLLNLSGLKMSKNIPINNRESHLNSKPLNLANSQLQIPKYSSSFSRNDSSQSINSYIKPIKSLKDVDFMKQQVLNTSLIGSEKAIIDAMVENIKEITSGLFDALKTVSNEMVNTNLKLETMTNKFTEVLNSNRLKDEQINSMSNQITILQQKLDQSISYNKSSLDDIFLKQNQFKAQQFDIIESYTLKIDQIISKKMDDIFAKTNNRQNEFDSKLITKLDEKFESFKSLATTNDSQIKENTKKSNFYFTAICNKYKRMRKQNKKKILTTNNRISKTKKKRDIIDYSSLKLVNTFDLMSISGLKWTKFKDNEPSLSEDNFNDLPDEASTSSSSSGRASVFDLGSY